MSTTGRLLLPYPTSTDTADVPRDIKALADRIEALTAWIRKADLVAGVAFFETGDLKLSAVSTVPTHVAGQPWVPCDGFSYLRADYLDLFNALGGAASPWGLPDGTHFKVPDFSGRSPMGNGLSGAVGAAMKTLGQLFGEEKHVQVAAEVGQHSHMYDDSAPYNSGLKPVQLGATSYNDGVQTNPKTTNPNQGGAATAMNVTHPVTVVQIWIKT